MAGISDGIQRTEGKSIKFAILLVQFLDRSRPGDAVPGAEMARICALDAWIGGGNSINDSRWGTENSPSFNFRVRHP
jgi:hypothetical protein